MTLSHLTALLMSVPEHLCRHTTCYSPPHNLCFSLLSLSYISFFPFYTIDLLCSVWLSLASLIRRWCKKDKSISGKPILLSLSLRWCLAASDCCLQVFIWCVCVCSEGRVRLLTASAHQVPTPLWLDLDHLNKHEVYADTQTSRCTQTFLSGRC